MHGMTLFPDRYQENKNAEKGWAESDPNQEKAGEGREVGSQMSEVRKYVKSQGDVRSRPPAHRGLRPGGKSVVRGWTNGRD